MPRIPEGSTVLVTGANGYLASHIIDQLLSCGFHVKGTVRSAERGSWLTEYFSEKCGPNRFELVVVPDMSAPDAFTEVMKGCSGVAHVASDLSFSDDPNKVIPGVVSGVQNILGSVVKNPEVVRFVLTSSSAAAVFPIPDKRFKVTKDSWNNFSVEQSWKKGEVEGRGYHVYAASKVEAERAMWKFMDEYKGLTFDCNAVLPNYVMGKILGRKYGQSGSTGSAIVDLYADNGKEAERGLGFLKFVPPQYMVNAVDAARLHVAALTDPEIINERLFAFAEPYNINEILQDLRVLRPGHKFPPDVEDNSHDRSEIVPRARAEQVLKKHFERGFTPLGQTIEEMLEAIDRGE